MTDREQHRCGRIMVGSGTDTYDPICELPAHKKGACRSTGAIDQNHISPHQLDKIWQAWLHLPGRPS